MTPSNYTAQAGETVMSSKTPRVYRCEVTGVELTYKGFGRPPKYAPEVAAVRARERRQATYRARKAKVAADRAAHAAGLIAQTPAHAPLA